MDGNGKETHFAETELPHHAKAVDDCHTNILSGYAAEIERACGVSSMTSDAQRDDYVAAGASHFILGMGGTWNYDVVENLVRWRNAVDPR